MNPYFIPSRPPKSPVASILLTLFLGPLGIFYSSIVGGLIMTFLVPLITFVITLFEFKAYESVGSSGNFAGIAAYWIILLVLYWPVCILWGVLAVDKYNKRIYSEVSTQMLMKDNSINQPSNTAILSPLQQWLKDNPGKGINDYYKRSK